MKKLFLLFTIAGTLFTIKMFTTENTHNMCDLAIANIECLAQNEGGGGHYFCLGTGPIDCNGYKVSYKISGFSSPLE